VRLKIFCMSIKHYDVLEKLPSNIIPFGLGRNDFPAHWLNEKKGENISHLNESFGEATGIFWIWKNYLKNFDTNDWIGFCQHRRLWLDKLIDSKQKNNFSNLYSNLLKTENSIFSSSETILLQPTEFSNYNLLDQFKRIYGNDIINNCISFMKNKDRNDFINYLNGNKFSICNMFITKPSIFKLYCDDMFNFINQCYSYCAKEKLLINKNLRLPIFMVERFTSFWFEKYSRVNYLSFARLGNFFLSNKVNSLINPLKLPFTFRMYPTIHKY
jgi:hypothetical protein